MLRTWHHKRHIFLITTFFNYRFKIFKPVFLNFRFFWIILSSFFNVCVDFGNLCQSETMWFFISKYFKDLSVPSGDKGLISWGIIIFRFSNILCRFRLIVLWFTQSETFSARKNVCFICSAFALLTFNQTFLFFFLESGVRNSPWEARIIREDSRVRMSEACKFITIYDQLNNFILL